MENNNRVVLSVIIVNYNVKHFLSSCLNSIYSSLKDIPAEIFVVDNDSSDGSVSMIREKFPEVHLIENSDNEGFAKANNKALKIAKGDFLLLLNPDTLVQENTFSECLDFFAKNPKTGGLGVRMIDGTGQFLPESKRGFPGIWTSFCKISGLYKWFPNSSFFNRYYLGHIPEFQIAKIEVLTGAFLMFPRKVMEKIGMLDERFFMYGEDVDFSYRINQAGYELYYLPTTTIVHYKGESTKKSSVNYIKTFYGAMILFVDKHYQGNARTINLFLLGSAIYSRAFIAMLSIPIKKILPHLIFFFALYFSILAGKNIWAEWYFGDIHYYPSTFEKFNVPLYILIFWLGYLFFGTFERQPDSYAPLKGWCAGLLIGGVVYAFLDLEYRNSRAILLISSLLGLSISTAIFFVIRLSINGSLKSSIRRFDRFILIGSQNHEKKVLEILKAVHPSYSYLGRVVSEDWVYDENPPRDLKMPPDSYLNIRSLELLEHDRKKNKSGVLHEEHLESNSERINSEFELHLKVESLSKSSLHHLNVDYEEGTLEKENENLILGRVGELFEIIQIYKAEEIIFCSGYISSKDIIKIMSKVGPHLKYKILTPEGYNLLGSQSKNSTADLYTTEIQFKITSPTGKRQKLFFDYGLCLVLLVGFPIILFAKKNPLTLLRDLFLIFARKKTWFGYPNSEDLPTTLPAVMIIKAPNPKAQAMVYFNYAKNYTWLEDLRHLFQH